MTPLDSARLCLVVPCYNDSERLAVYLPELCRGLAGRSGLALVVVDDGSKAAEQRRLRDLVESLRSDFPFLRRPLCLEANAGKGAAVYAGWEVIPEGEWLGFVDADGATPAREVARMIEAAMRPGDQTDAWIGSRIQMLGRDVHRTTARHMVGRIFATLTLLITGFVVYDSQCGCKLVRRSFYERVRARLVERRFAFDVDLLINLAAAGAKIREFPVDWSDVPGGKVSILRDGLQMAVALVRLRSRLGKSR